ncbi:hypothetical protein [Pseudoalteromonas piratica]|uniref:Uncharacterized protein n=1 Tax=Pseudoalteromonas piratica TaxID=1348114 RepID=A0A0A7EJD5_9GAMM|nr:hypothetical protein [Pseudoalteromonas piratica]AIY66156.1 hypothetical protein OM33_14330 [Pseudoalteromonas piratica]
MSLETEELLSNIKRQSKRLSKILSCPLGQAQENLAICIYQCTSYSDFLNKVQSGSFENPLLALTALSPQSELFLSKLLANNLDRILGNFSKKFPGLDINEEMVVSLFGLGFEEFNAKISNQ